jgi:hypothetical protein
MGRRHREGGTVRTSVEDVLASARHRARWEGRQRIARLLESEPVPVALLDTVRQLAAKVRAV